MISGRLAAQSDIYALKIQTVNGKNISLADFRGKKIIIVVGSVDVLQKNTALYTDSLARKYSNAFVLVVPATDHTSGSVEQKLHTLNKNYPANVFLSRPVKVRKDNGIEQSDFLKWLTHNTENGHFNADATSEHTYIISESGILYAVLEGRVSDSVFNKLLSQPDVKQ